MRLNAKVAAGCAAFALAASLGAAPGEAGAAARQQTIFDATAYLLGDVSNAQRRQRLNELDRLGVDTVRLVLHWRNLVPRPGRARRPAGFDPTDPRDYPRRLWAGIDDTVKGAASRNMRVLMTVSSPIPKWASASGRSTLREPVPAELRRLYAAIGARYSGRFRPGGDGGGCGLPICPPGPGDPPPLPRVNFWSVWNEPNQDIFLRPQRKRGKPYAGRLYRRLFLAAQAGLREAGHGRDALLIAETAPSGGRSSTDPIDFLRSVLCLSPAFRRAGRCSPIRATGWAHHPYGPGLAPFQRPRNPGQVTLANLGRLHGALRRAARAGATARRLPVYITEYGVQSLPDREFGVGLRRQAEYLGIAEFLAWRDRRVRAHAQYLMVDDPPRYEFAFTTGLRLHSGRRKPAYRAFPLTLAVRRRGSRVRIWGHLRPGTGRRRVEIRVRGGGSAARRLRVVRTNRHGYFGFTSPFRRGRQWRALGPGGLAGPWIRAYRF
jgi:hypothetical protein